MALSRKPPKRIDPSVRLDRMTRIGEPSSYRPDLGPCLIYLGADNGNGYGQFRYNEKNGYAHRFAWERVHGPIPDGLTVDHLCRVRRCVEVTHLELVDGVTNYRRGVASWSTVACRSGKHARIPENIGWHHGRIYCKPCRREREQERIARKPEQPDTRVRYDQSTVRAEIVKVRAADQTIAQAARVIGCNPNYLGRRIWRETREDVLVRDGHRCQRCGADGELDVHHRRNRGRGGTCNVLISFGMANLIALCRPCHHDITTDWTGIAKKQGWSVSAYADPATQPVLRFLREWAIPTETGWIPADPPEDFETEGDAA